MRIRRFRSGMSVMFSSSDLEQLRRVLTIAARFDGPSRECVLTARLAGALHELADKPIEELAHHDGRRSLPGNAYRVGRMSVRKTGDENADASAADEVLFASWAARVRAGLGPLYREGDLADNDSPRMLLIEEIHHDISDRFPLGIAQALSEVITSLHLEEDTEALQLLEQLASDERASRESNGAAS